MTLREQVHQFLYRTGGTYTATQICEIFNQHNEGMKLSSLSSVLKKMYDAHEVHRIESFGPRGGHGYKLNLENI